MTFIETIVHDRVPGNIIRVIIDIETGLKLLKIKYHNI